MASIPLETTNVAFALSNLAAIVGGILVVLGAAGIFFFGGIKEEHAGREQARLAAQTAEAKKDAALAQERAAALNAESERLKLEVEKERAARLKIEQRLAPRRISKTAKEEIKASFISDPAISFHLSVAPNNAEGDALINQIGNALLEAGWTREQVGGSTDFGAVYPEGVTVYIHSRKGASKEGELAQRLVHILNEASLSSETPFIADATLSESTIKIAAGFKPGRDG